MADSLPCWQANVVKGFTAGPDWYRTICCDYL